MQVKLKRVNTNFHFEGRGKSDIPVQIDTSTADQAAKGASPMELILMGVGGCSAIDIVSILQKQRQEITSYEMEITGDRQPVKEAKPFKAIQVKIYLEGKIDEAKAVRAAQLSFEKYCSVSLTLENVEVTYSIVLNGKEIAID